MNIKEQLENQKQQFDQLKIDPLNLNNLYEYIALLSSTIHILGNEYMNVLEQLKEFNNDISDGK